MKNPGVPDQPSVFHFQLIASSPLELLVVLFELVGARRHLFKGCWKLYNFVAQTRLLSLMSD